MQRLNAKGGCRNCTAAHTGEIINLCRRHKTLNALWRVQVGSRGPQLLLSVKAAGAQPEAADSQWSHRKICPGDNVTLVDTADFTVQAVHFAFAALLLLAYHVDCLQCFVSEEEAWRRLIADAGASPYMHAYYMIAPGAAAVCCPGLLVRGMMPF